MKTLEILERYKKIDYLIRHRNTGSPKDFASKLGISRSQLFNHLEELRTRGADIVYKKTLRSYVYRKPVEVTAIFSVRTREDEDQVSEKDIIYLRFPMASWKKEEEEEE